MYILRQFEFVIICMPLIFGQSMLYFWSELKKTMKSSKALLASWPCQHHHVMMLAWPDQKTALIDRKLMANKLLRFQTVAKYTFRNRS